jgi:hypothetical protein
MKKFLLIAAAMASVACSGSDDGEASAGGCSNSDRDGTYLLEYSERDGGMCGELPDAVGRLDADAPIEGVCERTAEDEWSSDQCKLTRSLRCTSETDGLIIEGVAVSEQEDSAGDVLTGLYTITARDLATGEVLCTSTYNVTATRQ